MPKSLILVDRSRTTTDWDCSRRRYLNYDLDDLGIVPVDEPIELFMGIVLHDALAQIATEHYYSPKSGVDIDAIAHDAFTKMLAFLMQGEPDGDDITYAKEQASLVEGIIRAFYLYQWPRICETYPKILAIEQEMSYEYGRLLYMAKPDLIAVNIEGEVVYIEYKSTANRKDQWIKSWETAIQLHSTTRAIEENLHEKVGHIIVQGLYKGYDSYGKQNSPFCYAYKRAGEPPFVKETIAYKYHAGLKRYPAWELPGGVKNWVAEMPEEILRDQFLQTPPIFVNDDMVEKFFAQRNIREQEIAMAKGMLAFADSETYDAILNTSFPQKWSECTPSWGRECDYKRICHGSVPEPLTSGWRKRTPHHAIELEAFR